MWGLPLSSSASEVYHPTSPALSTVSIVQSRAVTGDITTRKNIEQIRSGIEDNRIFDIRLEIGYDDNKRPEIKITDVQRKPVSRPDHDATTRLKPRGVMQSA